MPFKDPIARREHHRRYMRERYNNDTDYRQKHLRTVKVNRDKHRASIKDILNSIKARGCPLCPEREPCCMSFHHLDPTAKGDSISLLVVRRWPASRIWEELAKCVCVCENCHRKLHAGIMTLPEWVRPLGEASCGPQSRTGRPGL